MSPNVFENLLIARIASALLKAKRRDFGISFYTNTHCFFQAILLLVILADAG